MKQSYRPAKRKIYSPIHEKIAEEFKEIKKKPKQLESFQNMPIILKMQLTEKKHFLMKNIKYNRENKIINLKPLSLLQWMIYTG